MHKLGLALFALAAAVVAVAFVKADDLGRDINEQQSNSDEELSIMHAIAGATQEAGRPLTDYEKSLIVASTQLEILFKQSDEASLKRNPLNALLRGDLRYADQFGDGITDAYYAAERQAAEADLVALARIDYSKLSPDEQVSYDAFKWQRQMDLRGLQSDMLALTAVRPIDHFNGAHTFFTELSSGEGAAPYKTVADYENGLKRIDGFITYLDRSIVRMREGLASGVVQPKLVMANVVEQLDALISEVKPIEDYQNDRWNIVAFVQDSSFFKPLKAFPAAIPVAEQTRLRHDYAVEIATKLTPALVHLRDFIRTEYLPKARESVGLSAMPGGSKLYAYLVELNTTTKMTPEQIHQLGLSEVARLHAEMEKVKAQVGFKGTLQQFFEFIRTDPRFKPTSREALMKSYQDIGRRVAAQLPRLFSTMPKAPLDIRPVPALTEKGAARGSYQPGTPDGSRPGVFYFNAYDLPSRTTPSMTSLYLHEGAPGHHFQISLAQENMNLPAFQRFNGPNAFVEGWGLYAETLGKELGVLDDPYQYFGYLDSELFRAIRLVVDTGIHAKGWTRDQSIQYILDNSSRGRSNATAEVERYIAMPGQALAYKIGQLKIRELRTRAEKALGKKFDVREFHAQVLMTGALPLEVLEAKINRWIEEKKRG